MTSMVNLHSDVKKDDPPAVDKAGQYQNPIIKKKSSLKMRVDVRPSTEASEPLPADLFELPQMN